jgi:hypothetical protein
MSIQNNFPAIKPTLLLDFANTKALDSRITYTRATTATYYDGKTTALAEQNLLLRSQEFDDGNWSKANATIVANATVAPDGTTTAEKIYPSSTGVNRFIFQATTLTSGIYTWSIRAKAAEKNIVYIDLTGAGTTHAFFNLSTGAVGTVAAGYTATITNLGNGWYQCTATNNTAAAYNFGGVYGVADLDGLTTVVANGTDGIFIWGGQVERRSSVTAYTPTTTAPITNYIPVLLTALSGVARFDHNPTTGESLGLLIEEQRTNLNTYSEQFDNGVWAKANTTIQPNVIIAPDGTLTGDKMVGNTDFTFHYGARSVSYSAGTYTYSIYAKAGEYTTCFINMPNDGLLSTFNLSTGTVISAASGVTASIIPVGNGWYRIICTYTLTTTAFISAFFGLQTGSFAGNGFAGIYIWGSQLEQGSFATSYTPTVASQVTRAADAASMTGANFSSWFNQSEGSFYYELDTLSSAVGNAYPFAIYAGATNYIFSYIGTSTAIRPIDTTGGGSSPTATVTYNSSGFKASGAYSSTFKGGYVGNIASSTGVPVLTQTATFINVGTFSTNNGVLNGHIKKLTYYPIRCTNTQLQALTS